MMEFDERGICDNPWMVLAESKSSIDTEFFDWKKHENASIFFYFKKKQPEF